MPNKDIKMIMFVRVQRLLQLIIECSDSFAWQVPLFAFTRMVVMVDILSFLGDCDDRYVSNNDMTPVHAQTRLLGWTTWRWILHMSLPVESAFVIPPWLCPFGNFCSLRAFSSALLQRHQRWFGHAFRLFSGEMIQEVSCPIFFADLTEMPEGATEDLVGYHQGRPHDFWQTSCLWTTTLDPGCLLICIEMTKGPMLVTSREGCWTFIGGPLIPTSAITATVTVIVIAKTPLRVYLL